MPYLPAAKAACSRLTPRHTMGWRETVEAQPSEVHRKSQPIAQRPITSMRRPGLDDLPAFRVRFFAPIAIPLKYADIWWSSNPVLNPCLNSRSWRGRNHNISEGLRTSSMFNRLAIDATIPDRTRTGLLPPFQPWNDPPTGEECHEQKEEVERGA